MWGTWSRVPGGTFRPETHVAALMDGAAAGGTFAVGEEGQIYGAGLTDGQPPAHWHPVADSRSFAQGTPIAVVSDRQGCLDLFAADQNGDVLTAYRHPPQDWQGWYLVGDAGLLPRTPIAAISAQPGWIDLCAVGVDGHVRRTAYRGSQWQRWQQLGTGRFPQRAAIAAVSTAPGWMDLFGAGAEGHVFRAICHPWPWVGWEPVAAAEFAPGSSIAAVAGHDGGGWWIGLFGVGWTGHVAAAWCQEENWRPASAVGTKTFPTTTALTAAVEADGSVDLFAVGDDGAIYTTTGSPRTTWPEWRRVDARQPAGWIEPDIRAVFAQGTSVAPFPRPHGGVGIVALAENGHVFVAERQP